MASVEERVKAVTARVLKIDANEIKPAHSFTVDLGAESVQSIELVASFEEEFGIEMDEDQALGIQTVAQPSSTSPRPARSRGSRSDLPSCPGAPDSHSLFI